jgi:predicted DNA-binding protein
VEAAMQVRYNITMDKDVSEELETVAREMGEKKSRIIEKALTVYFDLLDLKLARKRLKDLDEGHDRIRSAEDVWEELDI